MDTMCIRRIKQQNVCVAAAGAHNVFFILISLLSVVLLLLLFFSLSLFSPLRSAPFPDIRFENYLMQNLAIFLRPSIYWYSFHAFGWCWKIEIQILNWTKLIVRKQNRILFGLEFDFGVIYGMDLIWFRSLKWIRWKMIQVIPLRVALGIPGEQKKDIQFWRNCWWRYSTRLANTLQIERPKQKASHCTAIQYFFFCF